MPTLEDALMHLSIDYPDEVVTANVTRMLNTSIATLHGAVGENVEKHLPGDPRIDELVYAYLDDLYSDRGTSSKVSNATRRIVHTIETQLRIELQRKLSEVTD